MKNITGALIALIAASPAISSTLLTNGTGDGKVSIGVNGSGSFGTSADDGGTEALYDPVGPTAQASTTYESYVYLGLGGGSRVNLSVTPATIGAVSATSVSSSFSNSGLSFNLVQSLTDLVSGSTQTGTLLTQTYSFTNTSNSRLSFDLVRYLDGDLVFNNTDISDGGGRLVNGLGQEILFETDTAIGSADTDTFIGIYNEGGVSTGYEIASFSGLRSRLLNGNSLANTITGDGADADQFIDAGNGYDVTLALGRSFALDVGGSGTFTTYTLFGTGSPGDVVIPPMGDVPEPSTWAMMILGLGASGYALRRRRAQIAIA